MVLKRGVTRCYDCFPRVQSKTFQVCTLRTLPDKPIHCLVWAKHLFSLIFGPPADHNPLSDILDSVDVAKALASPDLRLEVFRNVDQVFRKLYVEMLEEQKASNPEKFAFVQPLTADMIRAHADIEALPLGIDLEADPHQLHDLAFYISNFYSTFQLLQQAPSSYGQRKYETTSSSTSRKTTKSTSDSPSLHRT